ncbi:MAG: hypothetical protein ABSB26_03560 [Nitrososphaerales archaeon]
MTSISRPSVMRGSGVGSTTTIMAVVVIVIIAVAAGIVVYLSYPRTSGGILTVTPQSSRAVLSINEPNEPAIYSNRSAFISVFVSDSGSAASNVVLTLSSPAFQSTSSSPQDVSTNSTFQFSVTSHDMDDGQYSVNASASYSDATGSHQVNLGTFNVILAPIVKFTNVGWLWPLLALQPKSTIGPNDSTDSYVTVQSLSSRAQYSDITVTETFTGDHRGLTIVPSSSSAGLIGEQGNSKGLDFKITSNNAPQGHYTIIIQALSNGIVVAQTSVVLIVSS